MTQHQDLQSGDEVTVNWPGHAFDGKQGEIVEQGKTSGLYEVRLLSGVFCIPPTRLEFFARPEQRFYLMPPAHWDEGNTRNVQTSMAKGELYALVDEQQGGIIGYALGQESAGRILSAMQETWGKT